MHQCDKFSGTLNPNISNQFYNGIFFFCCLGAFFYLLYEIRIKVNYTYVNSITIKDHLHNDKKNPILRLRRVI